MKRAAKAERIGRILDELVPVAPVPLRHRDPYTLLVAVLLSAQCTDARVNRVTPALFARARTPQEMARLRPAQIERIIRPCGLSTTKARHLRSLSRLLAQRHGGRVPRTLAALEALPGVGPKTARVVMVQAFGEPAFPVDTHIHRLAARWGLSRGGAVARTERDLMRLFPRECWGRRHLQLIYFGRRFCPARGHDLARCPICSWAATKRRAAGERRRGRRGPAPTPRGRGPSSRAGGRSPGRSPA